MWRLHLVPWHQLLDMWVPGIIPVLFVIRLIGNVSTDYSVMVGQKRALFWYIRLFRQLHFVMEQGHLTQRLNVLPNLKVDKILFSTSLSDRISLKFFVPRTLRRVVAANRRVEWLERLIKLKSRFGVLTPEILHIRDCDGGVVDHVVDHSVHSHSHWVAGKYL